MNIVEAIKLMVQTLRDNYDDGELEDGEEPELAEAIAVAEAYALGSAAPEKTC